MAFKKPHQGICNQAFDLVLFNTFPYLPFSILDSR